MSTTTKPKVSIVTIVRNGANTIDRAMDSVLSQTYPNIEYIVIDGASTDGTVDLIRKYQNRLAYWSSEPDRGISDAFNKGIEKATGEWVGILNADDWYELDAVENIVAAGANADIVHGAMQYWADDLPCEVVMPNQQYLTREMTLNHPTVFVRRSVYERLGGFKENYRYAMDYELLLRFYTVGCVFKQLDQVVANMAFGGVSDAHWDRASKESRRAQIENGMAPAAANLMYLCRISRGQLRRFLERVGLNSLVAIYRKRFALVRKHHPS